MRHAHVRSTLIALFAVALSAGCRSVAVESEAGPVYALEVTNSTSQAMSVSYNDGTGDRVLGTVAGGGRQGFVVSRPATRTITVTATDQARSQTIRRTVTLQAGGTARVTL